MKLKKWQANLILLLTAIIWGSSYILIKMALKGNMPSGVINTLRGAIFAGLIYIFFRKRLHRLTKKDLRIGVLASFGGQTLQVIGQKYTDATSSEIILMTESLFGSLFSVTLGFEELSYNFLIGGTLIIVSILVMEINIRQIVFQKNGVTLGKTNAHFSFIV